MVTSVQPPVIRPVEGKSTTSDSRVPWFHCLMDDVVVQPQRINQGIYVALWNELNLIPAGAWSGLR